MMFWSAKGFRHELVDMRPALEVIVVGHEDDLPLGRDALEHIGAGADGVLHEGIVPGEIGGIGGPVLGDDLEAELGQGVQDRPLERELDRIVVDLLHALDELVAHLERRDGPGVHHDLVGEDHVVRGERLRLLALPGMPGHVLAQEEGIRAAVRRALPLLRQFGTISCFSLMPTSPLKISSVSRSEIISLLVIGSSVAGLPYSP